MKNMARDCGHEVKGALETDSVIRTLYVATTGRREGSTCGHTVVVGVRSLSQAIRKIPGNQQ